MDVFLQLTFSGLSNGMVYALVAVGFVIIYKASDVINFAQGEFLLLGAYFAFAFIVQFGLPWSLGVLAAMVMVLLLDVKLDHAHREGWTESSSREARFPGG